MIPKAPPYSPELELEASLLLEVELELELVPPEEEVEEPDKELDEPDDDVTVVVSTLFPPPISVTGCKVVVASVALVCPSTKT